jgi:hypothetical protein
MQIFVRMLAGKTVAVGHPIMSRPISRPMRGE